MHASIRTTSNLESLSSFVAQAVMAYASILRGVAYGARSIGTGTAAAIVATYYAVLALGDEWNRRAERLAGVATNPIYVAPETSRLVGSSSPAAFDPPAPTVCESLAFVPVMLPCVPCDAVQPTTLDIVAPVIAVQGPTVCERKVPEPFVFYVNRTAAELKALCRERGLKVSGNKDTLAARLMADDRSKQAA